MPVIPTRTVTVRKAWKRLLRKHVLPTFHMGCGSTGGSRSGGWIKRGFFSGGCVGASAFAACASAGASCLPGAGGTVEDDACSKTTAVDVSGDGLAPVVAGAVTLAEAEADVSAGGAGVDATVVVGQSWRREFSSCCRKRPGLDDWITSPVLNLAARAEACAIFAARSASPIPLASAVA